LQFNNPYFLHYKFLKLLVYSLSLLIPVIIEIILGFVKIRLNDSVFYIFSYLIYFLIYFLIFSSYYKKSSNDKNKFLAKLAIAICIYLAISIAYLW